MLVRLGGTRQGIGHAVGDGSHANRGRGIVGAGRLQIAAPLAVNLVHMRLLKVVVSPPTRKRS